MNQQQDHGIRMKPPECVGGAVKLVFSLDSAVVKDEIC